jgi:two-component system, OmpR family, phosphate regulon sensor histidine kinase PhoR
MAFRSIKPGLAPWLPKPLHIIAGFLLVVVSVVIAVLMSAGPVSMAIAVCGPAVLAAYVLIVQGRDRSEIAAEVFAESQRELALWQQRWNELHLETQQTASVLAQMRDGVIMLAPDKTILLINPAARRLLAFHSADALVGRSLPEVIRYPDLVRSVEACGAGDGAQEVIIEVRDGSSHRPIRIRVDRIASDSESNMLMTLRDETETRRVDEIRREFIANVSHELKTPLAAIKGYAETVELAIEDDPAAATHFMSQIRTQCLRLERLVSDMMQLARAQAGKDKLQFVTVRIDEVIAESLKSYLPVAKAKDIELTVDEITTDVRVTADREATLTIINNLIGNAVRYTHEGGHVNVGVRQAGAFWSIAVSDDGVGIAESEHERIFERFYRVERTRESARGGTGLGLSIVKNLTVALKGEVRLKSRPGEGSTFEVLLPSAEPSKRSAPRKKLGLADNAQ